MPIPLVADNKARTFVSYAVAALAYFAPSMAGRVALRLFSMPQRTSPNDVGIFAAAEESSIGYAGRRLALWRWRPRSGNGLKVLLVHGWSGNTGQFARWVPELTRRGYEVVAFDAPAHGASAGERTNLVDFAGAVRQVAAVVGGLYAVIAHSMGGAATIVAASEGLHTERIVLISTPDNVESRLDRFVAWLRLPLGVRAAMQRHLENRFGRSLASVRLTHLAHRIEVPVLMIHDAGDREIPWYEASRTAEALPKGELHTVRGLGHTRLLKDEGVIKRAVDFITQAADERGSLRDAHLEAYIERFAA